mgnify:CR=1 FL=1
MVATVSPEAVHRPSRRNSETSWDVLTTPLSFRAGDTNLTRYVGNSPTSFTDPSGLEKKLLGLSDIQALYDESQALVDQLRKDNPHDSRLLFFDTQQEILAQLAKGAVKCASNEELDWMVRVLRRFQGSLNHALQGQIQPGLDPRTGKPANNPASGQPFTKDELIQGIRDRQAGTVGGAWWGPAFDAAKNADKVVAGAHGWPFVPNAQEAAAAIMATAHIEFDLQAALLQEGVGTDATWACIGKVVEDAAKKHGRGVTNWLNGWAPRLENTGRIDPLLMRNKMRDRVKATYDQLRKDGKWNSDDPFKGLDGTPLLRF